MLASRLRLNALKAPYLTQKNSTSAKRVAKWVASNYER